MCREWPIAARTRGRRGKTEIDREGKHAGRRRENNDTREKVNGIGRVNREQRADGNFVKCVAVSWLGRVLGGTRARGRGREEEVSIGNGGSGVGTITMESPIIQSCLRAGPFKRPAPRPFPDLEAKQRSFSSATCFSLDLVRSLLRFASRRESSSDTGEIGAETPRSTRKKRKEPAAMDGSGGSTQRSFDTIDCVVFAGMLAISVIIGVYQAYKSRKNEDAVREYLVGGQNMSIFPITMSLIASYISGITILGVPAEMYVYGTQHWCVVIADLFVSLTMTMVYLPVFYGLGITSSYEYLNLRFNGAVRLMGSVMFLIKMLLYIPLVIYVPAVAFNQVTGINLHAIAVLVCVVCIFYTTLGGLKAVVWTDAIQTIVMFGGVIAIAIIGTHQVGGFEQVWRRNRDTDRIEFFDMDFDPTTRHTFWTVVVGNYFNWLASCSVNQSMVQRCLAMSNLKRANATITIMTIGIIIIVSLSCYTGIVIFAAFYDCDPIRTKRIKKSDQLLPFFVMEMTESIPGLPGLFVAGVFSAALSTMSTGLNSMSGVIYEDMIKPWMRISLSEVAASRVMKLTVLLIGIVCVTLVYLVEKLSGLIQAARSLSGITAGPLLGVFTLGMFFPLANSAGALVGGFVSLNLVAWISFGTQAAISSGKIRFPTKPVSIDGCPESLKSQATNFTVVVETAIKEPPFFLYRMSYLWYTWLGCLTAILVGLLVSWITGPNKRTPGDEKLYTPVIHGLLRDSVAIAAKRQQEGAVTELEKMDGSCRATAASSRI